MTKSTITRESITHDLKIYPEFFSAVCTGVKRAELRKNDRDYLVGDTLHLMETPRGSCHRTGEFINVTITHIADVGEWMPGYVLLSVELQERRKADSEPVAEVLSNRPGNDTATIDRALPVGTQLYRHAQQSVVPDGYVMVPAEPNGDMLAAAQDVYGETDGDIASTLRAAMLQGAEPVQGWIPCSERMPGKLIPVMVMYEDGEMWSAIWTGTTWDDGTEVPDPHAVTHWQEMPAAPQQEVK